MMLHISELEEKVEWTFYATLGNPGRMDDSVRELGGKIIYSRFPIQKKLHFLRELRKTISDGKYDILHCHHDIFSAVYLLASVGLPLRKRIVHVHNTSLSIPTTSLIKNFLLKKPMRLLCLHLADNVVGVSNLALDAFLKGEVRKIGRDMIINCGVDLKLFQRKPPNRTKFLQSIGLPIDSKILLFVGRMIHYKNPCFIINILNHLSKLDPTICAVFAGCGPLQGDVLELAVQNELDSKVRVLGWREDVPALMLSSDILIWPGLENPKEGLGLGVIEAQAAGLPVLMSLSVPEEAIVVRDLVKILPLAAGSNVWADKIFGMLNFKFPRREKALAALKNSPFEIAQSTKSIQMLYKI